MEVARQPIILLGMHRSGTAMIARLLESLGLFQGARMQEDHESTWFLNVNAMILRRINASWDHPAPIADLLAQPRAVELLVRCLEADLTTWRVRGYLGMRRLLRWKSLAGMAEPWGWKDPRTIFTLPLWLRIFPGARLVYIIRNGVDVAASLAVREQRELDRRIAAMEGGDSRWSARLAVQRRSFKGSARCLTLEGGFGLWEQYVCEAERQLASTSNPRHVMRYEQFLAEPSVQLAELARFCGLNVSDEQAARSVAKVDASRANAFALDADAMAFYERIRQTPWMMRYQYDVPRDRRVN